MLNTTLKYWSRNKHIFYFSTGKLHFIIIFFCRRRISRRCSNLVHQNSSALSLLPNLSSYPRNYSYKSKSIHKYVHIYVRIYSHLYICTPYIRPNVVNLHMSQCQRTRRQKTVAPYELSLYCFFFSCLV